MTLSLRECLRESTHFLVILHAFHIRCSLRFLFIWTGSDSMIYLVLKGPAELIVFLLSAPDLEWLSNQSFSTEDALKTHQRATDRAEAEEPSYTRSSECKTMTVNSY